MHRTSHTTLFAALALLVVLGTALAAGCTSSSTGGASTTAPTATIASSTAAVATTASSSSGTGSAVGATGYERLVPFIPKTAGALQLEGDAQGFTMKDDSGQEYAWATGTYKKAGSDASTGSIVIQDAATANTPLKQQWKSFTSFETTEGSMKSVTVKGQPAWEIVDKSAKKINLMAFVGDRYIVYVMMENDNRADLDQLVNAMDLAGLAALK
jgi:hypothetical protein